MGDWDKAVNIAKAGGTVISALGTKSSSNAQAAALKLAGQQAQTQANFQADQLEQNAGQAVAAGQRNAEEIDRQAMLLQSRALAVAAASGAGTLDPTVLHIIGGIGGQGEYAANTEKFNAAETARGMRDQAAATRYEGAMSNAANSAAAKRIKKAGTWGMLSTVLSGASSFKDAFSGWNK